MRRAPMLLALVDCGHDLLLEPFDGLVRILPRLRIGSQSGESVPEKFRFVASLTIGSLDRAGMNKVAIIVRSYPLEPLVQKLLYVQLVMSRLIMSPDIAGRSLPKLGIAIALLALVGLGAGYYFAAANTPSFTVTWAIRPLMIKFALSNGFSGSAQDSFTCSPSVSPVTLKAQSNQPDFITLTVSPSSFPTCNSSPDNITVTATCTAAHMDSTCAGDNYTGTVTVCGPTPYQCLKQV